MKKNTTTIIILLAAAGLGYYLWTKRRKTATSIAQQAGSVAGTAAATAAGQVLSGAGGGTSGTSGTTSGSGTGTTSGKINFTDAEQNKLLSKGQTGNTVKALQSYLKKAGRNIGASGVDGIFGTDTENALNDEIGKKTVTLKELYITGYEPSTGTVYGRTNGYMPEGILTGFIGSMAYYSYS